MADIGIRDVAARAGVSVATASYALNRPERVSAKSVALVAAAAAELGYVPNIAARQLKAGRSWAIGFAVVNLTNPFFADVALGAEDAADTAGYSLLVGNSHDSATRESRYLDLFERQRVDGVLLAPRMRDFADLSRFRARRVPVVLVDRVDPDGVIPSVSLDDVLGGRLAAEHLLAGGCRSILFVGGPLGIPQMSERLAGCRAVVEAAGARLTVHESGTLNARVGRELGERIGALPEGERPDGIFSGNDEMALGILLGLLRAGVDIPGDIAVIGYDDIVYAEAAAVPLTSVRQPSYDIGAAATRLLLAQFDGEAAPESVRFQPSLVVRQSTRDA
ncbi:LacI family DNA-binding transcriptional regulator [Microbacteriaceae bacterium VKM Ac-2854]|nr:LacI family DNA-binding transcriptional regulator [Microbacteriaceae bacterium VKM Ac-2854]